MIVLQKLMIIVNLYFLSDMNFKNFFLYCFLLSFFSCIQNPEAEIQNQRIKDLQEKYEYLNTKISEQNQKILDLKDEIKEINSLLSRGSNKSVIYKTKKVFPDSINVKVHISK